MKEFIINGGNRLDGEINIGGAKNSILPVLAATLLTDGECVIHNCPAITDVEISVRILRLLGCTVSREGHTVTVNSGNASGYSIPEQLMREMRSSIVFLGAIAARNGCAVMSSPGGCELGNRPIDLHLYALRKMGLEITEENGLLCCRTDGLKGCEIALSFPSVGATENVILSAATADGVTVLLNAAREPEISDLAAMINRMGGKISGAGESTVVIEGVPKLSGCEHSVIPDRIVTATYMSACAATGGSLYLKNTEPSHIIPIIFSLEEMGCSVNIERNAMSIRRDKPLRSVRSIKTLPYPGFPTDAQAPVMAAAALACGTSVFIESIFDSRFKHAGELNRLGARIATEGRMAVVEGVPKLSGAAVEATDLRGGAALVVAGLAAKGRTAVRGVNHIFRGYENLDGTLRSVGADIVLSDKSSDKSSQSELA